jgi:sulfoacetaldehyde dehydrogenase
MYDKVVAALVGQGGYLCDAEDKAKLGKQLFRAKPVNPRLMAQPPEKIAAAAGLTNAMDAKFFMVEETGVGPDYPFSGEKLSVVITLYKYSQFAEALDFIKRITAYQGTGHSCGIHTFNEDYIRQVGEKINVSRIIVRQPQCLANSGAWTNGMPVTMSLSCGTWGNNISTKNVTYHEFMNVSWLSYPIPSYQPSDEEIFGEFYNS